MNKSKIRSKILKFRKDNTNKNFKIDANLRDHFYYKGKYYTSHILSLLKKEYE